jgi:hypothetical protein
LLRLTALLWSQTTTLEDAADAEPVNWGVEQALASHHHHKHVVQTMEKAAAVPAAVAQTAAPAELTEPPKSCKEEGWCSNLAPLDDGTPHPNCVSWAKSTTSDFSLAAAASHTFVFSACNLSLCLQAFHLFR